MQPIKVLVIGDVHICDHPPGRRVDGYKDHILDKLYECVALAKESGATHVLFLGDIFHLKAANRVSHRLVQDMAKLFLSFEVPVIVLVGNHDITDGTLDTLQKQPLGTFEYLPNVTLLKKDAYALDEDIDIYPIAGTSDITIDDFSIVGKNKRDMLAVHQSIVPDITKEKEMLQDILLDAKAVAEKTNIDIILYGHQHRCDGLYEITREDGTTATFSNQGSICRLTIVEEDVNKSPRVLMLSFEADEDRTMTSEIITLKNVVPAHEAYRLDEHLEEKERSKDIDDIIKKLQDAEVFTSSIETVIKDVESRPDVDATVKKAALDLLEEVR